MRYHFFLLLFCFFAVAKHAYGQSKLVGHIYFQSSEHTPAKGVRINAKGSNEVFSKSLGEYTLVFSHLFAGDVVFPIVGEEGSITTEDGQEVELVNQKDLEYVILADNPEKTPTDIIVCPKGARDQAARNYYNIMKSSSEIELKKTKKELDALFVQQKKDYKKIESLTVKINKLESLSDSLILENAYYFASINTDNSSEREKECLALLDQGKSIQEAMQVLSAEKAAEELKESRTKERSSISELETIVRTGLLTFDFDEILNAYATIIDHFESSDKNPLVIADYYERNAMVRDQLGQYRQALNERKKVIDIREHWLKDTIHLKRATAYLNYNTSLANTGDPEQAIQYAKKGIKIRALLLEGNHQFLATSYLSLGASYSFGRQFEKALYFEKKGLQILENQSDPVLDLIAMACNNISETYLKMEDINKAVSFIERALRIRKDSLHFEWNHPYLGDTHNNLSVIYQNNRKDHQAILHGKEAIRIFENIYNAKHPKIAVAYSNLSVSYSNLGIRDTAFIYADKGLKLAKEVLSSHDSHLVAAYNNYALAQVYLSNYEEACTAQEKAIEIGKEIYPEYDVDLMNLYTLYSRILYKKEEYQKAYTIVSNLIQGMEKQGISTPYLGIHYVQLADIQIRLNQFGKAIISSKKAWGLVKHLPEDHPYYRESWDVFLVAIFKRAEYAFENGNYKEALIDFELLNSLTTNDVSIYMAGLCYAYFDEHDKAIQSFNKVLELRPGFLNANYYNEKVIETGHHFMHFKTKRKRR